MNTKLTFNNTGSKCHWHWTKTKKNNESCCYWWRANGFWHSHSTDFEQYICHPQRNQLWVSSEGNKSNWRLVITCYQQIFEFSCFFHPSNRTSVDNGYLSDYKMTVYSSVRFGCLFSLCWISMTYHICTYLEGNVRGLVSRKKLAKDKAEKALLMVKGTLDYSDFKDVDMVIEVSYCNLSPLYRQSLSYLPF